MNFILFDDPEFKIGLLPLTFTRPVADIRIGIFKISEKWEKYLGVRASFKTENYLSKKFLLHEDENSVYVNGSVCPTPELCIEIDKLENGSALIQNDVLIAYRNEPKNKKIF
ncbi:MAG TPA: putative sugar nucleotidyl transferase, partial [Cytophagaceae bacterium]|nr:putative sugar nucleotidyl transferase [Cytophagaceae bacterium]